MKIKILKMNNQYSYVGPKNLMYTGSSSVVRAEVKTPKGILRWIIETKQKEKPSGIIFCTYVIDTQKNFGLQTGILSMLSVLKEKKYLRQEKWVFLLIKKY